MKTIFSSDRVFQIWLYTVSHRQLLFRSNKDNIYSTRIEVLFNGVEFMSLYPLMDEGLVITSPATGELPAEIDFSRISRPWYRVESGGSVGHVAAREVIFGEDELEYFEPSSLLKPPYLGSAEEFRLSDD